MLRMSSVFCARTSGENSELAALSVTSRSAPAFPGWLDFLSQLWRASVCKSGSTVLVCSLGSGRHEHLESQGHTLTVRVLLGSQVFYNSYISPMCFLEQEEELGHSG